MGKQLTGQQMLFQKGKNDCSNILRASYFVCHEIAKRSKPFNEGDFVKDCIRVSWNIIPRQIIDKISLSRWTVARRIDEMSNDIVMSLKTDGSKFRFFSIAVRKHKCH